MRFLIKMAFWLGLVAFFLPSGSPDDPSSHGIDFVTAFLGAQEAMGDLGGFCERSPTACEAGGEIAGFVGARVADGLAFAFNAARGSLAPAASQSEPVRLATSSEVIAAQPVSDSESGGATALEGPRPYQKPVSLTDPMATAAIAADAVRRATGLSSFGKATLADGDGPPPAASAVEPAPVASALPPASFTPAVPTPAPRI